MSVYMIRGGNRLAGRLAVHGAKNAALPILAAGGTALASHLRMKKQSPDTVSGKPSNYSRHT